MQPVSERDADLSPPPRMDKTDMRRWRPAYHQAGHKETKSPIARGVTKTKKKLPLRQNKDELTLLSTAYEIPWQAWGGHYGPPIKIAPECPRKLKLGTQVLKGILKRYPKSFLQKTLLKKNQGPWKTPFLLKIADFGQILAILTQKWGRSAKNTDFWPSFFSSPMQYHDTWKVNQ